MKAVIIIPARFNSSRFPGKPLIPLLGKPMILWVAALSAKAIGKEFVFIATDDERIAKVAEKEGFNVIITSNNAMTGTDRIAEAAKQIKADIYLNVQGDEPLLDPNDILKILEAKRVYNTAIINGYCEISANENPDNINIPKLIFTEDKRLVYMSRKAIPGYKNNMNRPPVYYKQVCIYAYSYNDLSKYSAFGRKSILEQSEDIEILRFLELGATIRMVETSGGSVAVDIPEDILAVEKILKKNIYESRLAEKIQNVYF